MLEVEILGQELAPGGPPAEEVRRLCGLAAASAGIEDGHVAIEYVEAPRIARLNARHRGHTDPTDVLSFPVDGPELAAGRRGRARQAGSTAGAGASAGARAACAGAPTQTGRQSSAGAARHEAPGELGDVVICPEHTADLREAIVHGVLHLVGMDHETDSGEMLALQGELLGGDRRQT